MEHMRSKKELPCSNFIFIQLLTQRQQLLVLTDILGLSEWELSSEE
jgi:hypothetical protein